MNSKLNKRLKLEKELLGPACFKKGRISVLLFMSAVFVLSLSVFSRDKQSHSFHDQGIEMMATYSKVILGRVSDHLEPALARTSMVARDPTLIGLIEQEKWPEIQNWFNQKIVNCTEVELITFFSPDAELKAYNTISHEGHPYDTKIFPGLSDCDFSTSRIIRQSLDAPSPEDSICVGAFHECQLSQIFFNGQNEGLTIGVSQQVISPASGSVLGIISTRFRFDHIPQIIDKISINDKYIDIAFMTSGGEMLTPFSSTTQSVFSGHKDLILENQANLESIRDEHLTFSSKDGVMIMTPLSGFNSVHGATLVCLLTVRPEYYSELVGLQTERNYTTSLSLSLLVGLFLWKIHESNKRQLLINRILEVKEQTKIQKRSAHKTNHRTGGRQRKGGGSGTHQRRISCFNES
ncbi:MAG: hypothetical protein LR011_02000 [Verrucomicrobia bacterium]|nr:hypothetical protein [Verrucomicrobiota bacterium]